MYNFIIIIVSKLWGCSIKYICMFDFFILKLKKKYLTFLRKHTPSWICPYIVKFVWHKAGWGSLWINSELVSSRSFITTANCVEECSSALQDIHNYKLSFSMNTNFVYVVSKPTVQTKKLGEIWQFTALWVVH